MSIMKRVAPIGLNVLATCLVHDTCGGDLAGVADGFVFSRSIEDPICINVENHFYLRKAARCKRDAIKMKLTQQVIVLNFLQKDFNVLSLSSAFTFFFTFHTG